jgi:hypothetical protein
LTPALARQMAAKYLSDLRAQLGACLRPKPQNPPPTGQPIFVITEQVDLKERKKLVTDLFTEENVTQPHKEPGYLFEIFWLVPMALALQLQKAGHFLTALDWYQTVYAFNLSPADRKIYRGLELEGSITRNQFADAWYDPNNPETVEDAEQRMVARFSTVRDDFPPNIEDLSIGHVTLLVSRADGFTEEININEMTFAPEGQTALIGGAAQTISGIAGARRPNGSAWIGMLGKSPVGDWKLKLPNTNSVVAMFKEEKIEDIALVVTFDGKAPAWPI